MTKNTHKFMVCWPEQFKIPSHATYSVSNLVLECDAPMKCVWKPLTLKLYDFVNPSTSKLFLEGLVSTQEELITLNIKMLNDVGDVIEDRIIRGTIKTIQLSNELNWDDDTHLEIKVLFEIDSVKFE